MRRSALIFFSLAVVAAATVASCRRSSTEPSPVCTITIAPESHTAPAEGGTRTVAVTASDASCMWTASSKVPWVAITAGASGAGSATLVYAVAANQSPDERTGTLEISDKVHTITQAGQGAPPPPPTCTYSLSPTQVEVDFIGGTGTVQVATGEGCDWTAESDAAWLTIEDGATGSGPGSFRYRVAEHSDSGTRTATVTVVDQVFTVEQTGVDQTACTYSVIPVEHEPCMPGGSVTTRIETAPGCRWTAASTADWLTVGLASGHGPAELTMHFTDNYRGTERPRRAGGLPLLDADAGRHRSRGRGHGQLRRAAAGDAERLRRAPAGSLHLDGRHDNPVDHRDVDHAAPGRPARAAARRGQPVHQPSHRHRNGRGHDRADSAGGNHTVEWPFNAEAWRPDRSAPPAGPAASTPAATSPEAARRRPRCLRRAPRAAAS
jgi:hypothetical protein